MTELESLRAEVERLRAGRFTVAEVNDICHNLHGTVTAVEFAAGCAEEQRKLYGCAPDHDDVIRLQVQLFSAMGKQNALDAQLLAQTKQIEELQQSVRFLRSNYERALKRLEERKSDLHLFKSAFQFYLHGGGTSDFKIDCDALTDADIETIAKQLASRLKPFGSVEGIPRGGLRLAEAMKPYITAGPLLIADDVLTTGCSMNAALNGREAIGAVIFARERVPCPEWITPLFRMTRGDLS